MRQSRSQAQDLKRKGTSPTKNPAQRKSKEPLMTEEAASLHHLQAKLAEYKSRALVCDSLQQKVQTTE